MPWNTDRDHPFAGIAEKLKRTDQNVINLQSEITVFIESGKYPVIPHPNDEIWQEAVSYHRNKPIPLRFSVLSGEVVHHLRSCLDHLVWHFSNAEARLNHSGAIEFPIFEAKPLLNKEIERYERKVQGITNANVLQRIKDVQPYNAGANVADNPLLIIHNMDRFDKHRELVIVDTSAEISFPPTRSDLWDKARLYSEGKLPQAEHLAFSRELKQEAKVSPGIAFRQFGKWPAYPVIKGLTELFVEVERIVDILACEV
jgi:hypothetical protein